MIYFLMIFAGGITGLFIAGPGGSIFGAISGFAIAAWQELAEDETHAARISSVEWSDPDEIAVSHLLNFEPEDSMNDDIIYMDSYIGVGIGSEINPATCLPMIGRGMGGFDVAGNPYGIDLTSEDMTIDSMSLSSSIFDE